MESADVQQLSIDLRDIQPESLSDLSQQTANLGPAYDSTSDGCQSMRAFQATLGPTTGRAVQVSSAIGSSSSSTLGSGFLRQGRPGDEVNYLLPSQQQQHQHHRQHLQIQHHALLQHRDAQSPTTSGSTARRDSMRETHAQSVMQVTPTGTSTLRQTVRYPQVPQSLSTEVTDNIFGVQDNEVGTFPSLGQPAQMQDGDYAVSAADPAESAISGGYFKGLKLIPDPPDLEAWREKLFNVEETITMTEEQFQTYFPHVDNIYSHRSTQKYKRKPFVSHYWDCRLKGRPPGTPKSDDPNKKKRKRIARQRDLCDVKIKITEYFPGYQNAVSASELVQCMDADASADTPDSPGITAHFMGAGMGSVPVVDGQPFGVLTPSLTFPEGHPGAGGARFFTIQRVNGTGTGNGKNDGTAGGSGHKHTLDESDRVKKNSVQRWLLKTSKEKKKEVVSGFS